MDAIHPPFMLSAEWSKEELSWSKGIYIHREDVARALGCRPADLPRQHGVGACQPNIVSTFRRQAVYVVLLFLMIAVGLSVSSCSSGMTRPEVFTIPRREYATEFLTAPFLINRAPGICQFEFRAPVKNQWVYLDVALINGDDAVVMDFSAQMSYYSGVSGGESWSEGSQTDRVPVRIQTPGEYRLLIKGQAGQGETANNSLNDPSYTVQIRIKEDIILTRYYVAFAILMAIALIALVLPRLSFESRRWNEDS